MFTKLYLLIGSLVLATGLMFLFFGGTWEGVRIGLEIMGGVWILQIAYNVLIDDINEKRTQREAKKVSDAVAEKYFN